MFESHYGIMAEDSGLETAPWAPVFPKYQAILVTMGESPSLRLGKKKAVAAHFWKMLLRRSHGFM